MAITSRFPYLNSQEAEAPKGVWNWAKRIVDELLKWRPFDLMDIPIKDKPYYIMRVNADGTAFEYAPEELGLTGEVLTGLAKQVVRVNDTEDGYVISKEVLHTLLGVALTAGRIIRVNSAGTGFIYDKEVMETLRGVSLAGKAGQFVKVNAGETGFEIVP